MGRKQNKKLNVLMCCSSLSVKGGMVSVLRNYLHYDNWGDINIIFIPTHIEKNKILIILYFIVAYVRIFWLLLFGKIDIAHLHTSERGSFFRKAIIIRTCKVLKIKTIMHHHAAEFELFYQKLSDKKKKYVNDTIEMTDLNIVLSKHLVAMLKDKVPRAKVEVLYNAVKTNDSNPYNINAKNILFLGRLSQRKGVYDLLEVLKRLNDQLNKEVKVYLCGDGDINSVKAKIKEYGIENRIAYIGWTEGKHKEEFMLNSFVNILPSYNEGLPMTILETMAFGIPNISTRIASIPEVIEDGVNGYLIEPGDLNSLMKKLEEICTFSHYRQRFSDNSFRIIVSNFALNHNLERLKQMYRELLK